jgi:hypothetical protein
MKKLLVHEWVKNDNLDTRMISCKPLRLQALPFVYLGTVKLGLDAKRKQYEQTPRNSRRNLLPMKCINRSLLMGHEHVSRALVELMQIRKTPSGTDRILHHAPEAFDRIEVMPTMGR